MRRLANVGGAQDILAGRLTIDISGFTQQVAQAVKEANAQIANIGKGAGGSTNQLSTLKEMQRALKDLSASYKDYNSAVSAGNTSGADFFKQKITSAKELINVIHEVSKLELSNGEISKNTYSEIATQFQKAQSIIQGEAKKTQEAEMKSIEAQKKARQEYIALWERQIKQTDKQNQQAEVNKVTSAYKNLTTAISEYNRARQAGNTEGANYWRQQVESSNQVLQNMKQNVDMSNLEANQREKVNQAIQRGSSAYQNFIAQQSQSVSMTETLAGQFDKMYGKLKLIAGISLVKIFHDALSYAKDFDAAMTDIQIITGQTEAQALTLGEGYRQLASNLQVTSTDIAKTAATIYRQGYTSPKEVQAIIEGATKFGAVTGQTTEKALQSMTATMQNFRKDGMDMVEFVQRIGDTWSYMGDNVATTGEEISVAMDKMAASVNMVGVSFEQASSWAAIMLARTQQSGQVIGTQLNSLVARYAKVTSKGYKAVTSDDAGEALNFNDVSKALRQAGIEIFDAASSKFMEMDVMMDKLASKWDTLDEATQRYIATTLGGTRGMNYLLTLLNNYNDAVELQAKVEEGVMNNKYDAWLESVAAAQNNLKNSMETLYQIMSSDVLKGFYNSMAGIVDIFAGATSAVDGWNIKIVALSAGLLGLAVTISKIITMIKGLGSLTMLGQAGFGLGTISAAITIVGSILTAVNKLRQAKIDRLDNLISDRSMRIDNLQAINDELEVLANKTSLSSDEMDRFIELRRQFVENSPSLQLAYGQEGEKISSVTELLRLNNAELEKQLELQNANNRERYRLSKGDIFSQIESSYRGNAANWMGSGGSRLGEPELRYGDIDIFGQSYSPTEYVSYVEGRMKSVGGVSLEQAKFLVEQLQIAGREIDMADGIYREEYDRVMNDLQAFVITRTANFQSAISQNLEQILAGTFSAEQLKQFTGDNFINNLLFGLLEAHVPDEHTFETVIKPMMQEIGVLYARALNEGMSEDVYNALNDYAANSDDSVVKNAIYALTDPFMKAMIRSADIVDMDLRDQFAKKIASGLSMAVIDSLNKGMQLIEQDGALSDVEKSDALNNFISNFLNLDQAGLDAFGKDFTIAIPVEVDTSSISEQADITESFSEKVRALINDVDKLKAALDVLNEIDIFSEDKNGIISAEDLDKLVKEFPQLTEAAQAYADVVQTAEDGTLFIDMFDEESVAAVENFKEQMQGIYDLQEMFTGFEGINNIVEAMQTIADGDYSAEELIKILELFPEMINMSPEEMLNHLNGLLEEQSAKWGDLAAKMGIVLDEYKNFSDQVTEVVHPMTSAEKAAEKLAKTGHLSVSELGALAKEFPELSGVIDKYGKDLSQADKLQAALNKEIAKANIDNWTASLEKALNALDKTKAGTLDYQQAIDDLANSFNFEGLGTLDNLAFITQNLDNIRAAANGSAEAFRALQEAAWINVVGTSDADFSAVMNGMALVDAQAVAVGNMLARMGMGTVEYQTLDQVMPVFHYTPDGGLTVTMQHVAGQVAVWKPSAGNPFVSAARSGGGKGSSGGGGGGGKKGGGGGGGGGSSTIQVSEGIQKMVDDMADVQDKIKHQLKMIDLRKEYHDIRGEIQGVIAMTNQERDAIIEQNKVLEENISALQVEIDKQQAIIANNKESSTAYKQAAKDLEPLVKAHQEYSQSLAENTNRLEKIKKEVKEFENQALEGEIAVRQGLREILEDNAKYEKDILDSTVELQDEILDALKKSYEKQKDLAVDAAEARKDAIQDEIDKIDELIAAREKAFNRDKKESEISKLREKIVLISADPTRRKEVLKLQEELAEKERELAWDTYKEEMQAQKESLKNQSHNIDDYISEIEKKYDDLLKNPKALIEEMERVISGTDEEIIAFLQKNTEEFETYSDAKKKQVTDSWQDMINGMRGIVINYDKEIDEIMQKSPEEIQKWIQENSRTYQNLSLAEQQQFMNNWGTILENWKKAYEQTATDIVKVQEMVVPKVDGSGGSSGGGSGGGGGGSYGGGGGYYNTGTGSVSTGSSGGGSASLSTAADAAGYNSALNKNGGSSSSSNKIGNGSSSSLTTAMDSGGKNQASETKKPTTYKESSKYSYKTYSGGTISVTKTGSSTKSKEEAYAAAEKAAKASAKDAAISNWMNAKDKGKISVSEYNKAAVKINTYNKDYIWKVYREGGWADFTGPAWLDGSPSRPERILSAEQTQLFEDLIATLHAIKTVNVPGFGGMNLGGGGMGYGNLTIERIEINPQNLDSDADYELISQRVGEAIMDSIQRTLPIGGIRI